MITPTPLHAALNQYRIRVSVHKKGYEQEKYRLLSLAGSKLGSLFVHEISSVHVASYRDERLESQNARTRKKIAPGTVRLELSLLSSVFDMCRLEWGFCTHNPVKDIKKPKPGAARDRRLSAREKKQIRRYCANLENKELGYIVTFALETAMRQGEILGLRWENVNIKECIATLPDTKNNTRRDVPLSLKARDTLISMGPKLTGRVFSYSSPGIKSAWRTMMKSLGIEDLHFHDLRHEAVTALFELGTLNMMEVAAISGHKSLSMLKRYTHLRAKSLVKKLAGPKTKSIAATVSSLIPYPAQITTVGNEVRVRVLDFSDLVISGQHASDVVRDAQFYLLHRLITTLRDGYEVPPPDAYIDAVPECQIIMIDPLGAIPSKHT